MLEAFKDYLLEKWPVNRVVAVAVTFVTPFAAALGGTVTAWLADHLPYVSEQFSAGEITAAFVTGAAFTTAAIITMGYTWLKGWQFHEDRVWQESHALTDGVEGTDEDRRRALQDRASETPPVE